MVTLLRTWVPATPRGPAPKVRALLAKLKPTTPNILRTTCLLCWMARYGLGAAAQFAGLGHVPQDRQLRLPISVADAERFFSLAPV